MDYGKEAYFKISELERLMSNNQALSVSGLPFSRECPSGKKTALATYSGGSALIIVSVTSTGTGGIDIYYNDMRVSGVASGGTATTVFTSNEGGTLELLPAEGVTVTDAYVSAFGNKCGFDPRLTRIAADSCNNGVYAVIMTDGPEVWKLNGDSFTSIVRLGASVDFDIACSDNGTLLAYIDSDGCGMLHILYGRSAIAGYGCRKIATTAIKNGWAVATYDGSRVEVTRYDRNLEVKEKAIVRTSKTVTGIGFVKHADSLCLTVSDNGRNLILVSSDEAFADLFGRVTVEHGI